MSHARALLVTVVVCVACAAYGYDMGNLPQWKEGDLILGCALPPGTDIPQTDQWPAAAWLDIKGVQFVIYAKHLEAMDPETKTAKFSIWISVPPQYKAEIEQDHAFGPADAYAYLQRTGYTIMKPELYVGPGNKYAVAPGAQPWTAATDRCVMGVFEPKVNRIAPRAFAGHRIMFDTLPGKNLGQMKCRCPNYDQGETRRPGEEWTCWVANNNQTRVKVDQWGLPGCSALPAPVVASEPATPTTGATTAPATGIVVAGGATGHATRYDFGDLPKWKEGDLILGCALPPGTDIPQTDQWPAAAWLDIKGVQFVIYAKHLQAMDPETKTAKFTIWISVPPQYKAQVERDHAFGPADAYAYLQRTGYTIMKPELYIGPGNKYGVAPGAQPWTAATDRCVMGVFEPKINRIAPRAFAGHRIMFNTLPGKNLGQMKCRCPNYDKGERPKAGEEWIAWVANNNQKRFKVDQWGLPDCSPVPGVVDEGTTPTLQSPFVGAWVDPTKNTLTAIYPDGTWTMMKTDDGKSGLRAGNWSTSAGSLSMRTHLAGIGQLWMGPLDPKWLSLLVTGPYDLSMVWQMRREGPALKGVLRSWKAGFTRSGTVASFSAWDGDANEPVRVLWVPALEVYRPITAPGGIRKAPPELVRMLEVMQPGGGGGGKDLGPEFTHQTQGGSSAQ